MDLNSLDVLVFEKNKELSSLIEYKNKMSNALIVINQYLEYSKNIEISLKKGWIVTGKYFGEDILTANIINKINEMKIIIKDSLSSLESDIPLATNRLIGALQSLKKAVREYNKRNKDIGMSIDFYSYQSVKDADTILCSLPNGDALLSSLQYY